MWMSEFHRDERGMTLIELLVSIALGGIILTAALTMFLSGVAGSATVQTALMPRSAHESASIVLRR